MRYAILADVHANLEALSAVLAELSRQRIDRLVGLGDFVGYHADPNRCLELLRGWGIEAVAGNHDLVAVGRASAERFSQRARAAIEWTAGRLDPDHRDYLAALPERAVVDGLFVAVHGSLRSPHEYVRNAAEAGALLRDLRIHGEGVRLCFFGHTHRPAVYRWDGTEPQRVEELPADEVRLEEAALYAINAGSVGQSRDADPRASFVVYDARERSVRFHRVPYDYDGCARKARAAGLVPGRGIAARVVRRVRRALAGQGPGGNARAGGGS